MRNLLVTCGVICSVLFAEAQVQAQDVDLPRPSAHFTAIIVHNMDTSLSWYTEVLGCEIINQTNLSDRGLRMANLRTGDVFIELIELSSSVPPDDVLDSLQSGTRLEGFFKFGLKVPEFDRWIAHLATYWPTIEKEVVVDPVSAKRMVIVKDPDGNRIQIFEE